MKELTRHKAVCEALRFLAERYGLAQSYSSDGATLVVDMDAESYLHELSHALVLGVLHDATNYTMSVYKLGLGWVDALRLSDTTSNALSSAMADEGTDVSDAHELYASAVQMRAARRLGFWLFEPEYIQYTKSAVRMSNRSMTSTLKRLADNRDVHRCARDVVRLVEGVL